MAGNNGIDKINKDLDFRETLKFTSQDISLLQEYTYSQEYIYLRIEPLTDSLNFLKSEKGMFMGYLLLTLYA